VLLLLLICVRSAPAAADRPLLRSPRRLSSPSAPKTVTYYVKDSGLDNTGNPDGNTLVVFVEPGDPGEAIDHFQFDAKPVEQEFKCGDYQAGGGGLCKNVSSSEDEDSCAQHDKPGHFGLLIPRTRDHWERLRKFKFPDPKYFEIITGVYKTTDTADFSKAAMNSVAQSRTNGFQSTDSNTWWIREDIYNPGGGEQYKKHQWLGINQDTSNIEDGNIKFTASAQLASTYLCSYNNLPFPNCDQIGPITITKKPQDGNFTTGIYEFEVGQNWIQAGCAVQVPYDIDVKACATNDDKACSAPTPFLAADCGTTQNARTYKGSPDWAPGRQPWLCRECPSGWRSSPEQTSCVPCPKGQFFDAGVNDCTDCKFPPLFVYALTDR
jgi:hypothetical protein